MREILFRGKSIDTREWLFGDWMEYADTAQIWYTTESGKWNALVIPETRGQYTGLTDKNGVKIFEGDIVKTKKYGKIVGHSNVNDYDIFVVTYEPCVFRLINKNHGFNLVDDGYSKFEVIGNIYDNPELIKQEEGESR